MNIKKISIIVIVIVLAAIGYSYMISGNSGSASGVSKQTVNGSSTVTPGGAALDGPGKDFVAQLLAIQNIKFDLTLFSDPVFKGLQDYSQELVPQESGRENPFAPLDGNTSVTSSDSSFSGFASSDASSTTKTTPKAPVKTPVKK